MARIVGFGFLSDAFVRSLALVAVLSPMGCMLHQSSSERLMDTARDLNNAARFGRLDVAASATSDATRKVFLERRQQWGNDIRVVDVSLAGLQLQDETHAQIVVQYSWTRMDEGVLRTTATTQHWTNLEEGGWQLAREQHTTGDFGLFGERPVDRYVRPRGDAHFESKSLGESP